MNLLDKNRFFPKNQDQKTKFLGKNDIFKQKSTFWSKMKVLGKNRFF